jgi:hypothetical protein
VPIRIISQTQDEPVPDWDQPPRHDEGAPKGDMPHGEPPGPDDLMMADDESDEEHQDAPGQPDGPLTGPPPESDQLAQPEPEPPVPSLEDEFEEVIDEPTELDNLNMTLTIQQKIDKAIFDGHPLRIIYTTLKGYTTERTVDPDYYHAAHTTGNMILIAWCRLREGWRGFIISRIRAAKLEDSSEND